MGKKIPLSVKGSNAKSCEGCTKCCDGYLMADIDCKTFQCFWRASEIMPMEFKPSEVGVIVVNQEINDIPYLLLVEAGNKVPPEVLSWYVAWAVGNQLNVRWQVGNQMYALGSQEFHEALFRLQEAIEKQQKDKENDAKI
jgi:hypothetical protein